MQTMEFIVVLAWFVFLAGLAWFRTETVHLGLVVAWGLMALSALFAVARLLVSLLSP